MQARNAKNAPKSNVALTARLLFVAGLLFLSACSSLKYYGQSVVGHNKLMWARQPIDELIKTAEPDLKSQLVLSQQIRQFAVAQLSLPDNASYSSYVDLQRDYPVWTVVAAEEFSVDAKSWCYLVIGCASYRGYFAQESALDYAAELETEGFETSVGGAIAYSTLGWFSDPLLPSMMRYGDAALAENMFHELAHQVLYVNGNSAFNEAFASVVGEQGAVRWLQANYPDQIDGYQRRLQINNTFIGLLNNTKNQLAELYAQALTVEVMRIQKAELFEQLYQNYQTLKDTQWGGQGDFDRWFESPVNNARLASISTYREHMPALQELLAQCKGRFDLFFLVLQDAIKAVSANLLLENLPQNCEGVTVQK